MKSTCADSNEHSPPGKSQTQGDFKLLTNATVGKITLSLHNRSCSRQENVTATAAGPAGDAQRCSNGCLET